ncbi:reverse transcriptase domain-containing protein [Tanacetum coccineum]|uniref:Reverse transcriptase domain-containing protein n=1 Tax=Tanacetum coccineum TaxID=301880 RepID=A0ABQ4WFZ2_9ASTR
MQKEKEQQDKLKAVKARLLYGNESRRNPRNHEESHYSESKTPTARTEPRRRHGRKHSRSPSPVASVFRRLKQNPTSLLGSVRGRREVCSIGWEEKNQERLHALIVTTRVPKQKEPRTRMPNHAKTERWVMPTWCHMFNSTLTDNARVWFDKLLKESIDSYEDLREAFKENYRHQTKHIKDPVEIHHIKQRDGESTEDFMERYKEEVLEMEGAPECMKIVGFMHGITHPELIKHLYKKIPRSIDKMYRVTTSFLQGEVAVFSHGRKKAPTPSKQPEGGNKPSFKKCFKNKHRSGREAEQVFTPYKDPKGNFHFRKRIQAPPPMVTPAEKRDPNKRNKPKAPKKGETGQKGKTTSHPDGPSWERETRTGTEGPMIIEAEIGGHFVHRIYVDGEAGCSATTYLSGFSGETIFPLGQISLLVKIGDEEHSTSAWIELHGCQVTIPTQWNNRQAGKKEQGTMYSASGKTLDCFRMETNRHDGRPTTRSGAPSKCLGRVLTYQTKEEGEIHRKGIKQSREKVEKIGRCRNMKRVHYQTSNLTQSWYKKHDGSWRNVCAFKDLNKHVLRRLPNTDR